MVSQMWTQIEVASFSTQFDTEQGIPKTSNIESNRGLVSNALHPWAYWITALAESRGWNGRVKLAAGVYPHSPMGQNPKLTIVVAEPQNCRTETDCRSGHGVPKTVNALVHCLRSSL